MIVKLAPNTYVDWSSVCDAPKSAVMHEEGMKNFIRDLLQRKYLPLESEDAEVQDLKKELIEKELQQRLAYLEDHGTTDPTMTAQEVLVGNRAGPKETHLSPAEIIELYTYSPNKAGSFPFT